MKTLIKNAKTLGKYLSSSDELVDAALLIEDGKIAKLANSLDENADEVIDAKGRLLLPGLIDPQVHFREPGQEYKEDIESGSKAAAKGGFTTVISMPNTAPTSDDPSVLEHVIKRSNEVGIARVLPTGAVTLGLKGETLSNFESLNNAGAIAFTDDGKGIQKDEVMMEAFKLAKKFDKAILDHSEDESLSAGGSIHQGEVSEKYGVKGIKSESESVHVKRGCEFSKETGAHYHVLHISTKESLEFVRQAKKAGANVTCEVSPHHLLLCDEDIPTREDGTLNSNWKMNPPLRSAQDREACQVALKEGIIDAIATDHAPHAPYEKEKHIEEAPFGIIGLETAFPLVYTKFVKSGIISLAECVDLMTIGPAKLFKLPYGTMNIGAVADLTLIDLEKSEIIKDEFFHSKSKNSPFVGETVFGVPVTTIFGGKTVYQLQE
jgi:dihydroorotase